MADPVNPQPRLAPVGSHTQNTTLSSVVSVTVPDFCNMIIMQASTQNIRFTLDGTAPTTTKGLILKSTSDDICILPVYPGQVIKFIEETASAKLDYQFCKA